MEAVPGQQNNDNDGTIFRSWSLHDYATTTYNKTNITLTGRGHWNQGLVKGAILCFRNLSFYFRHGERASTASQLTSPASQKSKDLNKVSLLLQDLGQSSYP